MILIARLTIWETFRRKVLLSSLVMTGVFLWLFWLEVSHEPRLAITQNPLADVTSAVANLGLGAFFCYVVIAFFAIFSVSGAISSEIESGMLAAVVPRPVYRAEIVLGKWVGFALVQLCYVSFLFFSMVVVIRAFDARILPPPAAIVAAWALFVGEAWILSAVGLLGSVLLPTLTNGITLALGFLVAFLSGGLAQIPLGQSAVVDRIATVMDLLLPTDGLYRRAVFEMTHNSQSLIALNVLGPFGVLKVPNDAFLAYALVYLLGVLALTVRFFHRRDI